MAGAARARQGPRIKKEGKADVYRIGGVDLPWDPELDLDKPKPTPLYPVIHPALQSSSPCEIVIAADLSQPYKVPKPKPLTEKEKSQIACLRQLQESIKNGPLHTVLGDKVRVGKSAKSAKAAFDPFEGMPKYSQRYTKKKRMIPKLDTRPYGSSCLLPKNMFDKMET